MNSSPSTLQMLTGLYGYLIPVLLYVMWSTLALHDLGQRGELGAAKIWGWTATIFLLPFLGPLLYLFAGGARLSRAARLIGVVGGIAVYAAVLALALAISSG
ncbi:MAG TPA: PLDc N-terminal domain-containing protein [Steroidobacteraceae bacterium]|nr:PLDc N-terminal domain-containing protein [Steroidobacteraceae bacterium]